MSDNLNVQRGNLVASFYGKKQSIVGALFTYSIGIGTGGWLMWDGITVHEEIDYFGLLLFCVFLYATYRMVTRHKRPIVTVYEQGLEFYGTWLLRFPAKGFYPWDNIEKVAQERYLENTSPTYRFTPGYFIYTDNNQGCLIFQTLDGYVELYKLLYQHKVRNSQKRLYLYDVDVHGRQYKNEAWYEQVYDPVKDRLIKERGRPVVY